MTTNSDFQQYAAVHDALAWRAEAEAAHVARRVEAVQQAVASISTTGQRVGDWFIVDWSEIVRLMELVALLVPEGGEDE